MPITLQFPVTAYDQGSFHTINEQVMGMSFDIHNEFGRYLKEALYRNELARRCRAAGLHAESEFRIAVSLDDFEKLYFVDLLVERGVVIETKTVSALMDVHKGQTLNYLFLCELHHGTLLNFRTDRVQHQFVSTRLDHKLRQRYKLDVTLWTSLSPECIRMKDALTRCLKEWGAFLDPNLYRDALTHFFGGHEKVVREIPVLSDREIIGTQEMRLLTNDIAFTVTASTHRPDIVLDHQQRFLKHTPLSAIQWINLNHDTIELRTVAK